MQSVYDVCHGRSALSDVQIRILKNSEDVLQFASDLAQREISVYVPGKVPGTVMLAAFRRLCFSG